MSRAAQRHPTSYLSLTLVLLLLGSVGVGPAHAEPAWTLVMVPDTQHYVDDVDNVDDFVTQMQWIVDHIETHGIAFVSHIGDVVQHGDRVVEWDRAESAMGILDGHVPYAVAIGDHDYVDEERRASGAPEYLARFGPSRYAGRPWYGGASPDHKSHYQLFSAGGRTFLHLALEWEVPGSVSDPSSAMGWAASIMDAYPKTPTIISTHSYVWDQPGEKGRTNGIEEDDGDGASGEQIWTELVATRPQVFMLLNGNFHKGTSQYDPTNPSHDPAGASFDGEYHQVSTNLYGLPVYEMLANFQDYPNGGDGWIRLIEFAEGAGAGGQDRISVETYSTTHDEFQIDSVSRFHFDLDFVSRFDAIPEKLPLRRFVAATGEDSTVWARNPSSNYGGSSRVRTDSVDGGPQQGLLRFDLDFGGEIPAGAEIRRAVLHVALTDSGDGVRMHRMRRAWSEGTVTWNELGQGIDADGSDAEASPDLVTLPYLSEGESLGYSLFDVTASVRAWQDGAANHGWALMPQGSDKLVLYSFEGSLPPELVIDYTLSGDAPPPPQVVTTTVRSGADTYIWKKDSGTNFGSSTRIRIDYSDGKVAGGPIQPMQGLLRFDLDQAAIPADAVITRAELRLRLTDSGDGFRLHRMLVAWDEATATWDAFSDGIDDDGAEAALSPDLITDDFLTEPASATYLSFEVTAAVQAWRDGQANHGWAMLPLGDNKLIIESFQGDELQPELVVEYTLP
ncbi:DNRLRE domain-containing protein [Haliangium sp.]|uniref:DNRLRE domain-containing protein n=1 Tax=Haliangium sp. TaxID=2663208 RepID=UPI003D10A14D